MKMCRPPWGAIFKIDAYDERFLSSSVVTCGIEILSAYTAKFSR